MVRSWLIVAFILFGANAFCQKSLYDLTMKATQNSQNYYNKQHYGRTVPCSEIYSDYRRIDLDMDRLLNDPDNDMLANSINQQLQEENKKLSYSNCGSNDAPGLSSMVEGMMKKLQMVEERRKAAGKTGLGNGSSMDAGTPGGNGFTPQRSAAADEITKNGDRYEQQYGDKHFQLNASNKDYNKDYNKVKDITGDGSDSLNFDNAPVSAAIAASTTAPVKKASLDGKGIRIRQGSINGSGFTNRLIYDDQYVTVLYSLNLIRSARSFFLKSTGSSTVSDDEGTHVVINHDTIDFTAFHYRAKCQIINKKGIKLHIYGWINATPTMDDVAHITPVGRIAADLGFNNEFPSTYANKFYYAWDFDLTNNSFENNGDFWTEVANELPAINMKPTPIK